MIREAAAGDVEALAELHLATVTVAYADIFPAEAVPPPVDVLAAEYAERLDRGDRVWMSMDGESAVGSIALVRDADVPAGRRIERFHVHPDRQGEGVGRRLYECVLGESGGPPLNLWVLEANERARDLRGLGLEARSGRTLPNDPPEILDVLYELVVDTAVSLRSPTGPR